MDLVTLSDRYGHFLAPAFRIEVDGRDIVRQALLAVSQVEADLVLGAPARFSFTVVQAYDTARRAFFAGDGTPALELLRFGAPVRVCMGYGDAKSVPLVMSGLVSEIATSFPESGAPELTVAGYDPAFPLTLGKNTRNWSDRAESDAAHDIAAFHNLGTKIESTRERLPRIDQNQESDFAFLKKLAERNRFEIYFDAQGSLHFHRPDADSAAVVSLEWGAGLLSFKPEANLAGQVSSVEVHGWDVKNKRTIVGVARAGEELGLDARARSAGQRLRDFVRDPSKQPVLRLRQPVFTQSEADQRARAALDENAKKFLTGDAESIGLPEIRPDRNVQLGNLGTPFSKTYYVQQATHRIDGGGYRTRFKVKEPGHDDARRGNA